MTQDERTKARLDYWEKVVRTDESAWEKERLKMDPRDELYEGTHKLMPTVKAEEGRSDLICYHVRNVVAENIETMVDGRVPKPKVIPIRKEDEHLAKVLEHELAFWSRRSHLRELVDLAERMVPIQGGCAWLVEWDESRHSSDSQGDVVVSLIHPKQLIPQAGIYTGIEAMDHVAVKLAFTRTQIRQKFGVDLPDTGEDAPEIRGRTDETTNEADLVTVTVLYYRNEGGGVGLLAWAGDTVLADREDYQARTLRRCRQCGALDTYIEPKRDEERKELEISGQEDEGPHRCPWCEGTEFEEVTVDQEEVILPMTLLGADGNEIELKGARSYLDEKGDLIMEPASTIPYYKPKQFPIKLQKNISVFGRLLGESDVDKMADQQNTIKRLDKKILDRLVKAGTKISLPRDVTISTDTNDQEVIRLENPADAQLIKTYEFTGDISSVLAMSDRAYEEARQGAGITDSMQGRRDPTATSGAAKEFAAGRSEGRMESRRQMKSEVWAQIYEMAAKLLLSCADEPRGVRTEGADGEVSYETFDRHKFLKMDKTGKVYYEDGFLFECDYASSIGENRERMWQELTRNLTSGTLGDPANPGTLALYWGLMDEQGYPGAGAIRKKMEEQAEMAAAMPVQAPVVSGSDTLPGAAGMAQ